MFFLRKSHVPTLIVNSPRLVRLSVDYFVAPGDTLSGFSVVLQRSCFSTLQLTSRDNRVDLKAGFFLGRVKRAVYVRGN